MDNKIVVIGDPMVKHLKPNDLTNRENFVKYQLSHEQQLKMRWIISNL